MIFSFETLEFYRGVSVRFPIDRASVQVPRHDRKPKHLSSALHEAADKWFDAKFGTPFRSKGLFISSRIITASAYAASPDHVVRILPLSKYQYCWSPRISDLLFAANAVPDEDPERFTAFLADGDYRCDRLADAHVSGHEVMLLCDRYVAIPADVKGTIAAPKSILVLK
jgi:hypothetical protein